MPHIISKSNKLKSNKLKSNKLKSNRLLDSIQRAGESPYSILLSRDEHINNSSNNKYNKTILSPLSGHEPKYEPDRWNMKNSIKSTHNCFSYALNQLVSSRINKPQPGYFSKYPHINNNDYNCNAFYKRLRSDIPSLYRAKFGTRCKKGYYKVFLAVDNDTSKDTDYHFYRQDSNGTWSHKPGRTNVTNVDANGDIIINPTLASRKYDYYNYSLDCGYFCMNTKLSRAIS